MVCFEISEYKVQVASVASYYPWGEGSIFWHDTQDLSQSDT